MVGAKIYCVHHLDNHGSSPCPTVSYSRRGLFYRHKVEVEIESLTAHGLQPSISTAWLPGFRSREERGAGAWAVAQDFVRTIAIMLVVHSSSGLAQWSCFAASFSTGPKN